MGGRRRRGKKKLQLKRPKGKRNHNSTADGSSSAPPPPWIELPRDVTANILRRLSPVEILGSAQSVCTTWRSVCDEPSLWRVIDMKCSDHLPILLTDYRVDTVCRRAVDRSRGELIDINIEHFGNDNLLLYISDRSSCLKRLRLHSCRSISPQGLTKAVKNFPRLEELQLYFMQSILAPDIEAIGISCPILKSFMFNGSLLSIAKNMPNLQRLLLVRNMLSNEGLQAILDGCPNLKSLDLRQSFGVDLLGDIGKRCSEQIKELRGPLDYNADYDDELDVQNFGLEDEGASYGDYYDINSSGDDMVNFSDYGDDGFYENYDDYTNPFNDLPYPANLMWYLDRDD